MKRKGENNGAGYLVLAVIAFIVGRCSVEGPPAATSPQYLAAPTSEVTGEQASTVSSQPDTYTAPAASGGISRPGRSGALVGDYGNTASSGFTCEGKRYCREMTSCEEAQFYLNQCGVGRLDGDGDGVPCESIC